MCAYTKNGFISLIMGLVLLAGIAVESVSAQEKGPLMFNTQVGFTLGGVVAGAGIGAVVWLTDPLIVDIIDSIRWGVVVGSVLGSAAGFYVLKQAVIYPDQPEDNPLLNKLLGYQNQPLEFSIIKKDSYSAKKPRSPKMKLTLLHYTF
ncbi:hypothetical protein WDW89_11865 [Deltaproteobacteria bacterium TL4]